MTSIYLKNGKLFVKGKKTVVVVQVRNDANLN